MAKKTLTLNELAEEIIGVFDVFFTGDPRKNPTTEIDDKTMEKFLGLFSKNRRVSATPEEICNALNYLVKNGRIKFKGFEADEPSDSEKRTKFSLRPQFVISQKSLS